MRQVLQVVLAGVVVFGQERLPSTAPESGANLPARPIRSNDLLAITVYGAPELTRTVRVSNEGRIRLPLLREAIEARGLMPQDLETRIAGALETEDVLVAPAVIVAIAEYQTRPISVAGAVRRPLTFLVFDKITLLEALTRAEGLSPDAGAEILVSRAPASPGQTPLLERVPVRGLIDNADPALNLTLEGGEEVRVPEIGRVFVVGNVKKPGAFRMEVPAGMTILKSLALAEGLAPFAGKQAYIYRRGDAATPRELTVELRQIMDRKSPDLELGANDILYIPDSRRARAAANAIEKAVAFAAGTASGALILSVNR